MKDNTYSFITKLVDEKEAANFLSVSTRCMANWRSQGLIPWIKIGGVIRYRIDDLNRVLDEKYRRGGL